MKKILGVLLLAVMAFTFVACGQTASTKSPDQTIDGFCKASQNLDLNAMSKYVKNASSSEIPNLGEYGDVLGLMKEWAKQLKWEIAEPVIDGDNAKVNVEFSYADASGLMQAATAYLMEDAMSLIGASEEEIMNKTVDAMKKAAKEVTFGTKEESIEFELENVNGEWLITEVPEEFSNIISANIVNGAEDMFGGSLY